MAERTSIGGSGYRLEKVLTCISCKIPFQFWSPIPAKIWFEPDYTITYPAMACPRCGRMNTLRIKVGALRKLLANITTS
jgi:hypothetical protein